MGTATLGLKFRYHYRAATAEERRAGQHCGKCANFRKNHPIYRIGGELKGYEPRCYQLGLNNSIRYAVRKDFVCNMWVKERV